MPLLGQLARLVKDPPPACVFELSQAGLAWSIHGQQGFEAFPPGTLQPSPLRDNLLSPEAAAAALERVAPANGNKKRRPAAVILPDHAVRVSLLDFDVFPQSREEALQLVRFRVKKTIPFDLDSAAVQYWVQPASGGRNKIDVVAVTVALEILARYEALFRNAHFHPGEITPASLAALELFRETGVAVLAKLAGNILTVAVTEGGRLRLYRCLELEAPTDQEILSVLQPTFAFVEDELGSPVGKLVLCGFERAPAGLAVPCDLLRSRLGPVNGFNAGLLGYLEAAKN